MTERISQLQYKPVVIGTQTLGLETKKGLISSNFMDINIHTDSDELQENILMSGGHILDSDSITPWASLYYLVNQNLPFLRKTGARLRSMEVDYPGDIYMSPDISTFYFNGENKLGTLCSMVYGIHSLVNIDRGVLGLHSALIFDKQEKLAHLLVGRNRIGKSTIGKTIEDMCSRFALVSDDWNEVNLNSRRLEINAISSIFSPTSLSIDYEYAFTSFGKDFFLKHNLRPLPFLTLGKVIEIYKNKTEVASDDFLLKALMHIPLLNQNISSEDFNSGFDTTLLPVINSKKNKILKNYQKLKLARPVHQVVNDPGQNSVEDISIKVLNILSS